MVVSFPHVGLEWPAELGPRPQVSFPRNADYAVDRLYPRAEQLGAATIRARYSRLVVDLNRAGDDIGLEVVPDHPAPRPRASLGASIQVGESRRKIRNRGVVWRTAVGGTPLFATLSYRDFHRRIERYHAPYHRALAKLLERRRQRFGYAILLDAHSMPGSVGGDLVLGTRGGRSCGEAVRELAIAALDGRSLRTCNGRRGTWPLRLAVDDPYQGGEIVAALGQPQAQIHAIQLEVSRALYLDEYDLELAPVPPPYTDGPARPRGRVASGSRAAQARLARRRLEALVDTIDHLVRELSRERPSLAEPGVDPESGSERGPLCAE
nr:N-formylglutamate amidohydrolase [Pseudenhygromyxa sp. WMMC2535]